MELQWMFKSLKDNETVFFKTREEMSYSIIKRFYSILEFFFVEFGNFFYCPDSVAFRPEETPDIVQFDFIVGLFHKGEKVFNKYGIGKFWFEEDDQAVLPCFAFCILNRDKVEQINLCLVLLFLVCHCLC